MKNTAIMSGLLLCLLPWFVSAEEDTGPVERRSLISGAVALEVGAGVSSIEVNDSNERGNFYAVGTRVPLSHRVDFILGASEGNYEAGNGTAEIDVRTRSWGVDILLGSEPNVIPRLGLRSVSTKVVTKPEGDFRSVETDSGGAVTFGVESAGSKQFSVDTGLSYVSVQDNALVSFFNLNYRLSRHFIIRGGVAYDFSNQVESLFTGVAITD